MGIRVHPRPVRLANAEGQDLGSGPGCASDHRQWAYCKVWIGEGLISGSLAAMTARQHPGSQASRIWRPRGSIPPSRSGSLESAGESSQDGELRHCRPRLSVRRPAPERRGAVVKTPYISMAGRVRRRVSEAVSTTAACVCPPEGSAIRGL